MAFKDLKSYLTSRPILSLLEPTEDLYMYLAVSDHTVSSVLIRQHEGIQIPFTLPQQNPSGCRNTIVASRQNDTSLRACNKKINTLLPSPHCLGTDRAPFTIPVKNVIFHWKDSQVGDEAKDV